MSVGANFTIPVDLTGKLIIKAQLGSDIRKIPIYNEEITYDELLLMMQRLFHGKIKSSDDVVMKVKDEDGDLITIFDSSDLMFAKSLSRYLKLTLFVNGKPGPLENDQVKEVKNELIGMRDKINELILRLDSFSEDYTTGIVKEETLPKEETTKVPERSPPGVNVHETREVSRAHAAMFDPLRAEADTTNPGVNAEKSFVPITQNVPTLIEQPINQGASTYNAQQPPEYVQQQPSYAPTPPSDGSFFNNPQQVDYSSQVGFNQSTARQPPACTPQPQQYPVAPQQPPTQQYPVASQPYQPASQTGYVSNSTSYAAQGQPATTYQRGYPTDQQYQAGNPYRTMSPVAASVGRYPQTMQTYDYSNQPSQQNATTVPSSAPYGY